MASSPRSPAISPVKVNFWDVKEDIEKNFDLGLLYSRSINPNYLLKGELLFELNSFGWSSNVDCDVANLRQQYRQIRGEGSGRIHRAVYDEDRSRLELKSINEITAKIDEWLPQLKTGSDAEKKESFNRIVNQFLHVLNRIIHLSHYAQERSDSELINEIQKRLATLEAAYPVMLQVQKEVKSRAPSPAPVVFTTPVLSPSLFDFPGTSGVDKVDVGKVEVPAPPPVSNEHGDTEHIPPALVIAPKETQTFDSCLGLNPNSIRIECPRQFVPIRQSVSNITSTRALPQSVPQSGYTPVFNTIYNRLPNPIEHLLRDLPHTDGLVVDKLLKFIALSLKISTQFDLPDVQLFQILQPFSLGPLADRINFAINSNYTFDQFHAEVLKYFVPQRLLAVIEREEFYRLQRTGEPLSAYIVSIKEAAKLLRLNLIECEIVNTICSGLNPAERSRLIFHSRPQTYKELIDMSVQAQNLSFADEERNRVERPRNDNYRSGPNPPSRSNEQLEQRCFYCKKVGHIARFCHSNPNNSRFRNNNNAQGQTQVSFTKRDNEVKCYTCNKIGHYSRDCRNRKI